MLFGCINHGTPSRPSARGSHRKNGNAHEPYCGFVGIAIATPVDSWRCWCALSSRARITSHGQEVAMWRRHSCLPGRDASRPSGLEEASRSAEMSLGAAD